jgi:hypothetical protein
MTVSVRRGLVLGLAPARLTMWVSGSRRASTVPQNTYDFAEIHVMTADIAC